MKKLRIGFAALLVLFIVGSLSAQEYKIAVQNSKDGRLILKDFGGSLPIEGYSGNEIVITSESERFEVPERAKGLKPVYPGGTDNTGLGLDVQKSGNQVTVTCLLPFTRQADYKIKVPDNIALELKSSCERSTEVEISEMKSEIEIKTCHSIKLSNVTGPLVLSTIAGNIDIKLNNMVIDKPFSVNSISGDIDITLPAKTATNLELKTISGGFFSDFDLVESDKDLRRVGGSTMNYALNGGGQKFSIVTVSGNIYLRKGK